MNAGDLVKLTGVARFYIALEASPSDAINDVVFGILLKKRTEEFTQEDVASLGEGSHVWDVLVRGNLEKVWEIDLCLINSVKESDIVLDHNNEYNEENFRRLSRVMLILKDGRF